MDPTDDGATEGERVAEILRERARALGRTVAREDPEETRQLVVVVVAGERFGVDVGLVREVHPSTPVAPIPGTAALWSGLMNLRGTTYPVLDLARYLGLPAAGIGQVVVVVSHGPVTVALLADQVLEVLRVSLSAIGPPLGAASGGREGIVEGLTSDLLSVLDVGALLRDPALVVGEARVG